MKLIQIETIEDFQVYLKEESDHSIKRWARSIREEPLALFSEKRERWYGLLTMEDQHREVLAEFARRGFQPATWEIPGANTVEEYHEQLQTSESPKIRSLKDHMEWHPLHSQQDKEALWHGITMQQKYTAITEEYSRREREGLL